MAENEGDVNIYRGGDVLITTPSDDFKNADANVYPGGDVLLFTTPTKAFKPHRFRVSSLVLGMASPVLKTLLGPSFKEGATLAAASSVEIQMLEDNSEAWFLVCSALHMRHDKLPKMWELGQLLEDGKLCDKYALADAVRPYAYKWLNGCYARNVDQHSRAGLAAAAAMLGMNEEVAQIGVDLIRMSKGVIDGPAEFVAHLPEGLFEQLNDKRREIRALLCDSVDAQLEASADGLGSCHLSNCTAGEVRFGKLIHALRAKRLWPRKGLENRSVEEMCVNLKDLVAPQIQFKCAQHSAYAPSYCGA